MIRSGIWGHKGPETGNFIMCVKPRQYRCIDTFVCMKLYYKVQLHNKKPGIDLCLGIRTKKIIVLILSESQHDLNLFFNLTIMYHSTEKSEFELNFGVVN